MALSMSPTVGVNLGSYYNDFPTPSSGKVIVHSGNTTLVINASLLPQYLQHGWIQVQEGYAGVTTTQSQGTPSTNNEPLSSQLSGFSPSEIQAYLNSINQTPQTTNFD